MSEGNNRIKRQLNPFAFPSETDARFALLMISALAMAISLASPLLEIANPEASRNSHNFPAAPPEGLLPQDFFARNFAFGMQMAGIALKALGLPAILFIAILMLTTLLYWDHPRRVRARKKTRPFNAASDPRLDQEIRNLSTEACLPETPVIELGNGLAEQDGQAFGVGQRKSLRLGGGLRVLLRKFPETFRAVARHELAHIANRDIGRTYYAQSLWISVVLVTIVPLLILGAFAVLRSTFVAVTDGVSITDLRHLFLEKYPTYFWLIIQCLGLIGVVAWIWAGILRTRESYADWRAALWGSKLALMTILESHGRNGKANFNPFRFHPTASERLTTLNNPRRLFELGLDLPFIVGMLTTLLLNGSIPIALLVLFTTGPTAQGLASWLILFAHNHPGPWIPLFRMAIDSMIVFTWLITALLFFLPLALTAYLYSVTLGLQVQRRALADLAERKGGVIPYFSLVIQAGMVSLGMIAGLIISPFSFLAPNSFSSGVFVLYWLAAFAFFVWLVLAYLRFFSRRILGSHAKTTPPNGKRRLVNSMSYLLFLSIVLPFFSLLLYAEGSTANNGAALEFAIAATFLVPAALAFTFAVQWMALFVYRAFRPVHCPVCGKPSTHSVVVGTACPFCGAERASWLFVNYTAHGR